MDNYQLFIINYQLQSDRDEWIMGNWQWIIINYSLSTINYKAITFFVIEDGDRVIQTQISYFRGKMGLLLLQH
jgi:hypothetical protein